MPATCCVSAAFVFISQSGSSAPAWSLLMSWFAAQQW